MANEMYHVPGASNDPAYGVAAKAFSVNYLKALYDKMGAWKSVRSFDADVAAFGESVTLPSFPRLTAVNASMTDGTYSKENTSITPQTILINQAKAVGYQIPEPVFFQAKLDVRSAFAEEAGRAVSNSIDVEMVKLLPSLSNTAGALGSDLTDAAVSLAIQTLVVNHVDISNPNDMCWILPGTQFSAIRLLKSYEKSFRIVAGQTDSNGGKDIQAAIDTLYGIPVFFRSDAEMAVTGGKIGGLFYRDSVGIAIQRMPTLRQPMPVPGTINLEMLTWALFGIAVIKAETAVKILCK